MEDNLNPKDLPVFIPPLKTGKVIRVYDGDTITIASRVPGLYNSPIYKFSVRLNGIDAPEMTGKDADEKEIAIKARDVLTAKILGREIRLENIQTEKYGRLLTDIYLGNTHVNKWMIEERYAVVYDGGKKVTPKSWKKYNEMKFGKGRLAGIDARACGHFLIDNFSEFVDVDRQAMTGLPWEAISQKIAGKNDTNLFQAFAELCGAVKKRMPDSQ